MLIAIHKLFWQQKHAHSLSKKGTNSFSRYKIQTIHILEVQIILFIPKFKITCWDIIYGFLCTKYKLYLLKMIAQAQSFNKYQYIEVTLCISGLSIKAKYKWKCLYGSNPHCTLQPSQILKDSNKYKRKTSKKERGDLKKIKTCNNIWRLYIQNTRLWFLSMNLLQQVSTSSQQLGCQVMQVELSSLTWTIYQQCNKGSREYALQLIHPQFSSW